MIHRDHYRDPGTVLLGCGCTCTVQKSMVTVTLPGISGPVELAPLTPFARCLRHSDYWIKIENDEPEEKE